MVEVASIKILPEILPLYPPPKEFEGLWKGGLLYAHQYSALTTRLKKGRIHAPTSTGKSRAASFFAVAPFHRNESDLIKATFAYPTNILTEQQFERSLAEGLIENLGYTDLGHSTWPANSLSISIPFWRLGIPGGEELYIVKLTGTDLAAALNESSLRKADILEDFLDWLNQRHSFLVASPDVIAYAVHEVYASSSFYYHSSVKRRVHSMLRGRTLILDEYHQYDPFTLINIENLLDSNLLLPDRVLLLSATKKDDYFPGIPEIPIPDSLPSPVTSRTASRGITVNFHFEEKMPFPTPETNGLVIYIHDSVVTNRVRCSELRRQGIPVVQWDGTRKDRVASDELGTRYHLILGTSAIEVGLDIDADALKTEWWHSWMSADHIIQRIGRVGRREGNVPAVADVFIPGALSADSFPARREIANRSGSSMTKAEFTAMLLDSEQTRSFKREDYVSYYYNKESGGEEELRRLKYLNPHEKLRYSFRIPGSQSLFLDKTDKDPFLFIYETAAIINRYNTRPPVPDELKYVDEGWKDLCNSLGIEIGEDAVNENFLVIEGLKEEREYISLPKGLLEELRQPKVRKYYVRISR
ncbi:MAG: hypothetical protein QXT41_00140 [Thermoplasmatales archaeon]